MGDSLSHLDDLLIPNVFFNFNLFRACTFHCVGIQMISASCLTYVCLTVDVTSAL